MDNQPEQIAFGNVQMMNVRSGVFGPYRTVRHRAASLKRRLGVGS